MSRGRLVFSSPMNYIAIMAIYTHLSFNCTAEFIAPYGLGELAEATGIAEGIENTNYLLAFASDKKAILTLFEKRTKPEDLPFYMSLMGHLQKKGINCPFPYATAQGEVIRSLSGRAAVLISFMQGRGMLPIAPQHCAALGQEMARMHLAVQDFAPQKANDFAPNQLGGLYHKTAPHLDALQPGLSAKLAEEITQMQQWPQLGLPQGVIHADLFPDNVLFERKKLTGIIDFYFSATDYFAYDLAICLNAWCFDADGKLNPEKATALQAAYELVRPLSAAERKALPFLARGAALRFLLTRAHDWFFRVEGAVVTPKDPMEYLRKWEYWCAQ